MTHFTKFRFEGNTVEGNPSATHSSRVHNGWLNPADFSPCPNIRVTVPISMRESGRMEEVNRFL